MKNLLIATILFLNGCASSEKLPRDAIALDLPKYVRECACELNPKVKAEPADIDWKNKEVLKTQVKYCKCALIIRNFDDVVDPLDYIKPGTKFYAPQKLYPWEENPTGALKPVEDFKGNLNPSKQPKPWEE